ncbi:MAG: diguanylate cyclase [Halorhodospira halophila]|uniref:diguanylate cyclase domain-containing protein n=1 Tax=Halorhodospira halophila TaxID=1053 RepID=UPI0026EE14AC|nr:diguanylate cyclase [Halorhodospira halophila]MCC3750640.1 diguanylate cyclase [Halorhodospira halophila]
MPPAVQGLSRVVPLLLALGVFVAVLILAGVLAHWLEEYRLEQARSQVTEEASALRGRIEGELNASVSLVTGLGVLVGADPEIDGRRFAAIAQRMMRPEFHIRNITLAPDNVIRYVYPLASNVRALGLDISEHPAQSPSLQRVMATSAPVVAGPTELVQGGEALIVRVPVHEDDGRYWGVASVPLDLDSFYRAAGLREIEQSGLQIALRGRDGLGRKGGVFFGEPLVFERNPVRMDITFGASSWQLAAIPEGGWQAKASLPAWWWWVWAGGGVMLALLGGVVARQALWLRFLKNRLEAIMATIPDLGFVIDDRGQFREVFGGQERRLYRDLRNLVGRRLHQVLRFELAESFLESIQQALAERRLVTLDYELDMDEVEGGGEHGPRGRQWFEARIYPLPPGLEARPSVLWLAYNVTERMQALAEGERSQEQMRHMALHDHLTGLANRALLLDRLEKALEWARRNRESVALLFIDLNHFKPINDEHGHEVGDRVLQELATRLTGAVREVDTVARHGGDEFVILLEGVDSRRAAERVADNIVASLDEPVTVNGLAFPVSLSIGIALYPEHGSSADELQRVADDAMYAAKADRSCSTYAFGAPLAGPYTAD